MLKTLSSENVQIFQSSFSVHSSCSVTVQLPDSMTGSNIGGIISGVSVTLILIITVSVVVTSLVIYIVFRYISVPVIMYCNASSFISFTQIRQKRKKTISKSDMVELNCDTPLCE